MADPIRIKRGTRAQLNAAKTAGTLAAGEPYLVTDEPALAVGTGTGSYLDVGGGTGTSGTSAPMNTTFAAGTTGTLGTTEAQLASVTLNVSNASSKVLLIARASLTKDTGTTARTATLRVRAGTTNSDTQVGKDAVIYSPAVASAAYYGVAAIVGEHSPGATGNVTYSLRGLVGAGASTASNWELEAVELTGAQGPKGADGAPGAAGTPGAPFAVVDSLPAAPDPDTYYFDKSGDSGSGGGSGTGLTGSKLITGDYTLVAADNGSELQVDSPSLAAITCDPTGLPLPFECSVRNMQAGIRFNGRVRPVDGDLLLFLIFSPSTTLPGTSGSGYTPLTSAFTGSIASPGNGRLQCAWKLANSSTDVYPWSGACNTYYAAVCLAIRDADPTTPVEASLVTTGAGGATSPQAISAGAITTLSDNALVIGFASLVNGGTLDRHSIKMPTPAGYRDRAFPVPTASGTQNLFVASKTQPVAGTTGPFATSASFSAGSGNTGWLAGLLSIKPAAGKVPYIVGVTETTAEQSAAMWNIAVPKGARLQSPDASTLCLDPFKAVRVRCFDGYNFLLERAP